LSGASRESHPERDVHAAEFAARVRTNQQILTSDLKSHYDLMVRGSGLSGSVAARRLVGLAVNNCNRSIENLKLL
jgi:choline dehydrogenase